MSFLIAIDGDGPTFECAAGQTILEAALRSGVELPYSCRKGVCGSCAGSIESGAFTAAAGLPLRNEACLPGQVLYCACTPESDLVLQPTRWKRADAAARKVFTARVHAHEHPAPDVSLLRLRLPLGQRLRFRAGQYLQVRQDDGSARSYSIANPPHENDSVTLHVRHVSGGRFTGRLATLKAGDTLSVEAPFGDIALDLEDTRPIVFVAGGTGFAPVKSIIDDMMKRQVRRSITLVWGARDPSGLYLIPAVERWQRHWPEFKWIPACSDVPVRAPIFQGRADEALADCCPVLDGYVVHCCGSPAMVHSVRVVALAAGVAPADFHADAFVPGPAAEAPDASPLPGLAP